MARFPADCRTVRAAHVRGWASTLVVVLLLGGVQLLMIGILGEYMSRIYDEVKQRPMYVIGELRGFEEPRDYLAQGASPFAAGSRPEPSFDR